MKHVILLLVIVLNNLTLLASDSCEPCPDWMKQQIDRDMGYFKKKISLKKLERFFQKNKKKYCLVKVSIDENRIEIEHDLENSHFIDRMNCFKRSFIALAEQRKLPNVTLLISMHDEIYKELDMPVFAMAKEIDSHFILLPDFEALNERYQVLENKDITEEEFPWSQKKNQLVWRGSSGQRISDGSMTLNAENMGTFSRVTLCRLSQQFPELINAGFTLLLQVEDPELLIDLKKEYIDYDQQVPYKYHLLIDGNTSSYSNSGWKFFINSTLFIPDSTHIQWYYHALIPYSHYIPVAANLEDLVDKLKWAAENDNHAARIAKNARMFAKEHLTIKEHLLYLYYLLISYSQLKFIP